jgi:hypothetical protein
MGLREDILNTLNTSEWKGTTQIREDLEKIYEQRPYNLFLKIVAFFDRNLADVLRDPSIDDMYICLITLEEKGFVEDRRKICNGIKPEWRRKARS